MDTCMTVWHWPDHERWYDEGICRTLARIRDAGFTHINWNADSGSSYWLSDAEITFTRDAIAESGLKVHTLHASNGRNLISEIGMKLNRPDIQENRKDILSTHEWQRQSGVELVKNRVDLAAATGAPNIVLHVDITDDVMASAASQAAFFEPLYRSLDDLKPHCRAANVKIAVENLFHASAKSSLTLFERLFTRYRPDFLGLCYDSGHWELIEPGTVSILERFADRLIATHIHDNFGAIDDHLLPFDGRLDWPMITAAIAATPYAGPLTFETPKDRYGLSESTFYHRAYQVAARLEAMVSSARDRKAA